MLAEEGVVIRDSHLVPGQRASIPCMLVLAVEIRHEYISEAVGGRVVVNMGLQVPATQDELSRIPLVIDGQSDSTSGVREAYIKDIQEELLSLTLQYADVRRRIRSIQHAVIGLVNVFGSAILDDPRPNPLPGISARSSVRPQMASLCREVLKTTEGPLTSHQIVEAIQHRSPVALSGFKNPGSSLSNILRGLHRRGEVEAEPGPKGIRWRWTGDRQ